MFKMTFHRFINICKHLHLYLNSNVNICAKKLL